MQAIVKEEIPSVPGTPYAGGFYVSKFELNGELFALVVAPKAGGQRNDIEWNESSKQVEGAVSYIDGMANTEAMATAGSELAKWARELQIGGFNDWYIPSQDELELCYRYLKPTTEDNTHYMRSGINLSAVPPTRPYTKEIPVQTSAEPFRDENAEAFDERAYWSSTQCAGDESSAWAQCFSLGGFQDWGLKCYVFRARAVRKIKL